MLVVLEVRDATEKLDDLLPVVAVEDVEFNDDAEAFEEDLR